MHPAREAPPSGAPGDADRPRRGPPQCEFVDPAGAREAARREPRRAPRELRDAEERGSRQALLSARRCVDRRRHRGFDRWIASERPRLHATSRGLRAGAAGGFGKIGRDPNIYFQLISGLRYTLGRHPDPTHPNTPLMNLPLFLAQATDATEDLTTAVQQPQISPVGM